MQHSTLWQYPGRIGQQSLAKQAFGVVVEESGIASSAQIGLVLNRVHFAALQILHHDCTVRMLALESSAASMASGLRSRCVRGVPSIEISNRAPVSFIGGASNPPQLRASRPAPPCSSS